MRKNPNRSRNFRQAARLLAGACASLMLVEAAHAQAVLWTTNDDFSSWDAYTSGWTAAGDTTFDVDGSSIDGLGNSTTPGAAGTPGSLELTPPTTNNSFTYPAYSAGIDSSPALTALDPGSIQAFSAASAYGNGSTVQFYGTMQMTYTIPDNNSGGGGYIEMGLVLNYDGNFGQYFPSVFGPQFTLDGQTANTVQIPYVINAEPDGLNYFTVGVIWNSNYAPTLPVYVDDISVLATPLEWNNGNGATGDGATWDMLNNQNWSDTVAESQGGPALPAVYSDNSNVTFDDNNNGNYNVTLNTNVSPVSVTFANSGGNYVLSGSGGIIGTTSLALTGTGSVTISTTNTYTGATTVSSGTLIAASPSAISASSAVTIGNATTPAPAEVQLAKGIGAVTLAGLTVNSGGTLDITNNPVIINYGAGPDPIATIVSYLTDGYNSGWLLGEINSSVVAADDVSQTKLSYSVGYADGADGIVGGLPSGEIEILPTLAGDAKLQGNVVFGDFQILAQYFGQSGGWDEGNFKYGSTVNFGDFQLLAQDFGATNGGLSAGEIASLNSFAAQFGDVLVANSGGGFSLAVVPEPASIGLLAIGGFGLLARRRKSE
ncbi:MAG TPA: PEP-CTERM sorting domain-containing protein [Tepidisphaeraceae bacterium]|nr:PEP-CTERM sorting domain-containing protein [Tepidisphaeraceae bacterium]